MKKIAISLAITSALMLGVASQATASAAAAPEPIDNVAITAIGYDAINADREWNRNNEYVDVKNTSETEKVDITGLLVQDSWRRQHTDPTDRPACNTFTVSTANVDASLVDVEGTKVLLPAGHTLRVYVGSGKPAAFWRDGRYHAAYIDSKCGYHGHFLNNDRDSVWITLADKSESKSYDVRPGHVVKFS